MRAIVVMCMLALAGAAADAQGLADPVLVGSVSTYVVVPGDTVTSIAGRSGMTVSALVGLNGLRRADLISPGQSLSIDTRHLAVFDPARVITINVAQRMLFFNDGGAVSGYAITVGQRGWPTPLGAFTIVDKERDPVWDVPKSIQREMEQQGKPVITRMEPSPDNPLGAFWLRLSLPGLGIHGTNAPASIYRYASHGCIRMNPGDIAVLFDRVEKGTTGVLIYQPIILAVIDDRVLIEAHPDPYRLAPDAERDVHRLADEHAAGDRIDWTMVGEALRARAGRPVDVTRAATTR